MSKTAEGNSPTSSKEDQDLKTLQKKKKISVYLQFKTFYEKDIVNSTKLRKF